MRGIIFGKNILSLDEQESKWKITNENNVDGLMENKIKSLFFLSKFNYTTLEPVNQKVTTVYAPDILSKGFIIAQKQAQSW